MIIKAIKKILLAPLVILLIVMVSPLLIGIAIWNYLSGYWLNHSFRRKWGPHNKFILFVFSESPNWQKYIEENILPKIDESAVLINWSKRSKWKKKKPLEARIMKHWGGDSEFNPMAIVFEKNGKIKTIRFYQAFKDLKHGKSALLKEKESELFAYLQ